MLYCFIIDPTPAPFIIQSNVFIAGTSGTLSCDYAPLSVAIDVNASVTWAVNGSEVTDSRDGRISTDGLSLIFSPLTGSDSGRYTCTLSLISLTPHVTVQGPQESAERMVIVYSKNNIGVFSSHSQKQSSFSCPCCGGFQEDSSISKFSHSLLEPSQHCSTSYYWLQLDLCPTPGCIPSTPVSLAVS